MFMGEFHHTLDTKGRVIIPAKFRKLLGNEFVITRGMDGCLFGYPLDQWNKLESQLDKLPLTKKDARAFTRFFYSAAAEVEFDKQGRINLSSPLIDFAKLNKNCVIVGVSDRIEIWDEDRWNKFSQEAEDNFEEISEKMTDFDF
ncbi:division/cell wall cluster transcriptional repressor MraZ [Companilactobacillus alimentarius]|uniref:Transcriptional regulator MraZ n=1 Tax=Companilactobacillus alimentarius DSM 20249 TaxID=1423720 RepID=A0A2K9HEI5_9LACO|nr:division/cell wall cluster transcriptional repressor MraZ [Companilactobacillus alimentarius]AUI70974.1 cell division/cell wall cluster transcriptional repressor MraZ [Companilactobacillus alimentarius DSM 20249]MDT6951776.1 division/cell wall cluster transcriptional repressor MraZ [Companilactobacillus alimentarius]GEO44139.1 transcriptional regulator MraZ [Companilactobacillus alimentarius]